MKKSALVIALIMVLAPLAFVPSAAAATEDEIEASIDAGIEWLASQQNETGYWGDCGDDLPAITGFALVKLVDRARELGVDPFNTSEYEYAENVILGFEWLESQKNVQFGINDSQTNNNGQGIYFTCVDHETYNTAIALMAFANINGYEEYNETLVQDMVDWFISTQNTDGAWRYGASGISDNSNTGYAVIGLAYAENAGAIIPNSVKTGLNSWVDVIQDPVNGGSWYTTETAWVNSLKTGNLILEMGFVGDDTTSGRLNDAVDYLVAHWNDVGSGTLMTGWKPHNYQAMYCIMKGLEYMQIEEIDGIDWFEEISDYIVENQHSDGYWDDDPWADSTETPKILSTEWALLTLEKVTVIKEIPVGFDVKPGSCPNPINIKSNGVQPMAIAGSEEFDVYDINISTLKIGICVNGEFTEFEGVAPLRWVYSDVTENYIPEEGEPCCIRTKPDGITDLSMKYATQELVEAGLGDYEKNDELCLCIKGTTYDGEQFVGRDCIIIK
ncbi:prenyltransferase/squalene oxidase repeat-containing protein [Methanococcus maripaludis]|uniref:Prenyltransferase beta subunit n=1 Tax=Methanococcus maripaludis TaxID=39152 RepID=A0A7J9RZH2_METMI|nr:prenyltransferase/squalene oxidase repeat-containing protein [Methanococcus maripaludis]MBB6067591.1 prenyltransferase beta subunit [Methanococcus maripaludis]